MLLSLLLATPLHAQQENVTIDGHSHTPETQLSLAPGGHWIGCMEGDAFWQLNEAQTLSAGNWRQNICLRPGREFKACAECPTMVVIPAGSFTMGGENDPGHHDDELPNHKVSFAKPFAMGKYEVTFRQWYACVDAGGCRDPGNHLGSELPVIYVSWGDIQKYLAWLNKRTGQNYRLPSEAEWEYAARAGTNTPFHTGATITTEQANFDGGYTYNGSSKGEYRQSILPVGSFAANAWGLHHVHGNVWEWVEDCWHSNYNNAPVDGAAWLQANGGICEWRVLRGGSWYNLPAELRAANRLNVEVWNAGRGFIFGFGFRLAQDL